MDDAPRDGRTGRRVGRVIRDERAHGQEDGTTSGATVVDITHRRHERARRDLLELAIGKLDRALNGDELDEVDVAYLIATIPYLFGQSRNVAASAS